jgi:hypothetical protein
MARTRHRRASHQRYRAKKLLHQKFWPKHCRIWPPICDFRLVWSNEFGPVQYVSVDLWLLLIAWQHIIKKKLDTNRFMKFKVCFDRFRKFKVYFESNKKFGTKVNLKQSWWMKRGLSST